MTHNDQPTIIRLHKSAGIAGQFSITADVQYPHEPMRAVTFIGSTYGEPGPVVMRTDGSELFVSEAGRFGASFGEDWVRAFFARA